MINLKIGTSFVSPLTVPEFTKRDWLPIFVIRNIANSSVIGKYSDTAVHFKDFAPSNQLFRDLRDGVISREYFEKLFTIEMASVDIEKRLLRIKYLCELSGARGAVLMGYGSQPELCHRSVLSSLINSLGLLEEPIKEFIL